MTRYICEFKGESVEAVVIGDDGERVSVRIGDEVLEVTVASSVRSPVVERNAPPPPRAASPTGVRPTEVRSPIPGIVSAVHVSEGLTVPANAPLFVIEAMKMENPVTFDFPVTIASVEVTVGVEVTPTTILARLVHRDT